MCELFAMSSRSPADVRSSLEAFARHGGLEGPHKDGWGLAYYSGDDVRLVKESEPASGSECMRLIHGHPFVSGVVISHIRKATQGRLAMKNCQPFARRLAAQMRALGPANFLYADGDVLFIHGHKRSPGGGQPPRAPGLHVLSRACAPDQHVVIAASVPLTQEPGWQSLTSGELLAVRGGEIIARVRIAARQMAVA